MTKNEFIERMILIFFSQYRNKQEEIITKTPVDRYYSWDEMLDFTDPKRNGSFERWRACLKVWGAPDTYVDFFARFIIKAIRPPQKNKMSCLTVKDADHIFSLACVMSYALEKGSHFYDELKIELHNFVFGLSES